MAEQVPIAEIPSGFIEYSTAFKEPMFSAWFEKKQTLLNKLYTALSPSGVDLEKVSGNPNPKNLKEAQITIVVPRPSVVVNLGLGELKMTANNADWSQAPALIAIFKTVLNTVSVTANVAVQSQQAVLAFHVKPGPKPFRDIMKQFVDIKGLGTENPSMIGVGIYSPDYSLIIDISAVVTDGVFVKVTRVFKVDESFEAMAAVFYKDEIELLQRLGLRLQ